MPDKFLEAVKKEAQGRAKHGIAKLVIVQYADVHFVMESHFESVAYQIEMVKRPREFAPVFVESVLFPRN